MMAIIDLHCDTITECCNQGKNLMDGVKHYSLSKIPKGQCWCQCFAIWMPDTLRGREAAEYFEKHYDYFIAQVNEYSGKIWQAFTLKDIENLIHCGKNPAILTVEGGSVLCGDLKRVPYLAELGVRMITLTWNGANEIGSGQLAQGGLTDFGREAVHELEKYGIIIDVSHLNDQTFDDVMSVIKRPPVASHSNSRTVYPHKRNLTDQQFSEIVKKGGLVGINYFNDFIDHENPSKERLMEHIKHFIKLGGAKNIALGSDFDGADIPDYIDSPAKLANLRSYMIQSGLSEKQVDDLYFNNAYNYFARYGL